tara:strand:- start:5157 stop:5357 length:201 start_codon:yes stop_codon:yes gene_type:complete
MDTLFGKWLNKKAPEIKKEIDPDPSRLSVDTAYKTRWIWYHTILALELLLVNVLLIAILVVISLKL